MIIKSLEIKNFRKIRNLKVDFPLKGVISIVGNNESGKSTLLDAIEIALFGFSKESYNPNIYDDNFITWGNNELKIKCEFISSNEVFSVTRMLRRVNNKKRKGKYQFSSSGNIFRIKNEKENEILTSNFGEITKIIEKITGFTLSMFNRLVYVKQHDLEVLKKIRPIERKALLDKLIGLEHTRKYDKEISEKIKDIKSEITLIQKDEEFFTFNHKKYNMIEEEIKKLSCKLTIFEKRKKNIEEKIKNNSSSMDDEFKEGLSRIVLKNELNTLLRNKKLIEKKRLLKILEQQILANNTENLALENSLLSLDKNIAEIKEVNQMNHKKKEELEIESNKIKGILIHRDQLLINLEILKNKRIMELEQTSVKLNEKKHLNIEYKSKIKVKISELRQKKQYLDDKIIKSESFLQFSKIKSNFHLNITLLMILLVIIMLLTFSKLNANYSINSLIITSILIMLVNKNFITAKTKVWKIRRENKEFLQKRNKDLENQFLVWKKEYLQIESVISKMQVKITEINQNYIMQDIKDLYASIEMVQIDIQGIKALKETLEKEKNKYSLEHHKILSKINSLENSFTNHSQKIQSLNHQKNEILTQNRSKNIPNVKIIPELKQKELNYDSEINNTSNIQKLNIEKDISGLDENIENNYYKIDLENNGGDEGGIFKMINEKKIQLIQILNDTNRTNNVLITHKRTKNYTKILKEKSIALKLHIRRFETEIIQINAQLSLLEKDQEAYKNHQINLSQINSALREKKNELRIYNILKSEFRKSATVIRQQIIPLISYKLELLFSNFTCENHNRIKLTENLNSSIWNNYTNDFLDEKYYSGGTQHQLFLALRIAFSEALLEIKGINLKSSLFLDECFSSSDSQRKERILTMLRENKSSIFSQIFIITHDKEINGDYQFSMMNGVLTEI